MAGAFEFAFNFNGANSTPVKRSFPVAAAQALKVGDPVFVNVNQVTKGGNGFTRALGVMAQDAASLAAGTLVDVFIAQPGQVWKAKASADATTFVLGARTFDLNASLQVNTADTTGGCMEIIALGPTNTDVLVTFTTVEMGA